MQALEGKVGSNSPQYYLVYKILGAKNLLVVIVQCCKNKMEFECDAWTGKDAPPLGTFEMVPVVDTDGVSKLVRIPSGRAQEVVGKSVQDGNRGAKEGIKWQDKNVPPKIQIGLALDLLETLLRYFLCFGSVMLHTSIMDDIEVKSLKTSHYCPGT